MKVFLVWLFFFVCGFGHCLGQEAQGGPYPKASVINGQGTILFHDGSEYAGEIRDKEIHGQGSITFSDGSRYTGGFQSGEMNGPGTMTFPDGSEYVGEFRAGTFCGRGVMTFPDGSRYEGEFKDDNYNGDGVWSSPLGIRYEGRFKDGRFDGQGVYILPDGSRYAGYFENDHFMGLGAWSTGDSTGHRLEPGPALAPPVSEEQTGPSGSFGENNMTGGPDMENTDAYTSSELAFSVQVGAFLSRENAERLAMLLRDKGYEAQMLAMRDALDRPWYTVRLGESYSSLEEAQKSATAFTEKEKMTAIVRPFDSL